MTLGLDRLVKEIEKDADAKAQEIINLSKGEASKILGEARSRVGRISAENKYAVAKSVEEYKNRELSSLNLTIKRRALNTRKEIIDAINEKARAKIANLADNEKILEALLKKAQNELDDAEYAYCKESDRKLVQKLAPKLKLRDSIDCLGGVIVENSEGTVMINYTYDVLFENVVSNSMAEIYKRVFNEI
jgi:V/A-type H+-transporting ATPase subunit E